MSGSLERASKKDSSAFYGIEKCLHCVRQRRRAPTKVMEELANQYRTSNKPPKDVSLNAPPKRVRTLTVEMQHFEYREK